jgi:indolepyruvate ferredoxin oxidoreductase alpha subunit
MDTIFPSDIGCYTLGLLPPLSAADFLICMGSSVGTSGGFSQVNDQKVISFIGDSTFFHSGIPGLINAVYNNHNFTLVILDNGTTAMTGHQPNPGVDMTLLNMEGYGRVSIEKVVRAIGVEHVTVIKPYKVKKSIEAIKEAIDHQGISVIISEEICALYANALKLPKHKPFHVSDKCKNHKTCIDSLACPAFYIWQDRVKIDANLCTGCAVCAQICPENAIRPVKTEADAQGH